MSTTKRTRVTVAHIAEWMDGSLSKLPRLPTPESVLLLLHPFDDAAEATVLAECVCGRSLLPAPADDPRIFVASSGQIHVVSARTKGLRTLSWNGPPPRIKALLATTWAASPLNILARVAPGPDANEELWWLSVSDTEVLDAVRAEPEMICSNLASCIQHYHIPRCIAGGTHCLHIDYIAGEAYVMTNAGSGIEDSEPLLELKSLLPRAARWVSPDKIAILAARHSGDDGCCRLGEK